MNGLEFTRPEVKQTDEKINFQEERRRAEMRVTTMFDSVGAEAIGRIRVNPKIDSLSERNLNFYS